MSSKPPLIELGQASIAGLKPINQDFIGALIPKPSAMKRKGALIAIADGISSSNVSQIASETAVKTLIQDYYCTSDAWTVKKSAIKVLTAVNYWLYAQTRNSEFRFDFNKGYVCTLSALILHQRHVYLFHCGDTRILRFSENHLEQLTRDHRNKLGTESDYLANAFGLNPHLNLDYQSVEAKTGDIYILASDGFYEHVSEEALIEQLTHQPQNLTLCAQTLTTLALDNGSADNISVQLVKIGPLPHSSEPIDLFSSSRLPLPPALKCGDTIDDLRLIRELSITSRSHLFVAKRATDDTELVIKLPSAESRDDEAALESLCIEEWVGRRLHSPYLLKSLPAPERHYLYTLSEYVRGITLAQWLKQNSPCALSNWKHIMIQIAKGIDAMHRHDMIHQDLRPENILIDENEKITIIDFGATHILGLTDNPASVIKGTMQFTAPEYFVGHAATPQSDLYSLGAIGYYLLTNKLPYNGMVSRARSPKQQRALKYTSINTLDSNRNVTINCVLQKALQIQPRKRYHAASEFVFELTSPNVVKKTRPIIPLIERNPLLFWQRLSLGLATTLIVLLVFGY
ncbi:bifunctional protein-serine/threonine kinase/phosphatase [Vibrio sp. SM6]|uniref:Bifunctional protein-serine/threonine kinase/phosphatase n=1 Tax=Vibrio agarilyticus TaxID=2726741 RepID=A0A7X8TRW1_9VIBR|nr:bifunctional protein-serine/threonine kinase/phosphatase [Vibrio agarilyticus]NLS13093.1 bifunctional protein-serine/threonine kinase/phosphatase [Vibrio agarilyticus]